MLLGETERHLATIERALSLELAAAATGSAPSSRSGSPRERSVGGSSGGSAPIGRGGGEDGNDSRSSSRAGSPLRVPADGSDGYYPPAAYGPLYGDGGSTAGRKGRGGSLAPCTQPQSPRYAPPASPATMTRATRAAKGGVDEQHSMTKHDASSCVTPLRTRSAIVAPSPGPPRPLAAVAGKRASETASLCAPRIEVSPPLHRGGSTATLGGVVPFLRVTIDAGAATTDHMGSRKHEQKGGVADPPSTAPQANGGAFACAHVDL